MGARRPGSGAGRLVRVVRVCARRASAWLFDRESDTHVVLRLFVCCAGRAWSMIAQGEAATRCAEGLALPCLCALCDVTAMLPIAHWAG